LSVAATILSGGRSSRLYENVVRQKQLSSSVMASAGESRGPGLFRLAGMANPGKPVAELEQAIDAEVERLKAGPIEPWEIEKARNIAKRSLVASLTSSLSRAVMLSQLAVYYNDPNLINTRYERLSAITAADVQRVAAKYFTPQNRTVVITTPKAAAPAPGSGVAKGGLR
jgi:zinc protease